MKDDRDPPRPTGLPADWYDGKPKRCPGAGEFPRVIRTGEDQDHGQGHEHVYLSHCRACDKPMPPSERAAEHTFIPVRPDQEYTFKTGKVLMGIELPKCDGDHGEPRCAAPCCHLDLSDADIEEVIGDGSCGHLPQVRMAQEIKARRAAGAR